jgi:hypothetical protein
LLVTFTARERGVATAEKDDMIQLRAGEAERSCLLHHQEISTALALAAGPIAHGRDDNQFLHVRGDDKRVR